MFFMVELNRAILGEFDRRPGKGGTRDKNTADNAQLLHVVKKRTYRRVVKRLGYPQKAQKPRHFLGAKPFVRFVLDRDEVNAVGGGDDIAYGQVKALGRYPLAELDKIILPAGKIILDAVVGAVLLVLGKLFRHIPELGLFGVDFFPLLDSPVDALELFKAQ